MVDGGIRPDYSELFVVVGALLDSHMHAALDQTAIFRMHRRQHIVQDNVVGLGRQTEQLGLVANQMHTAGRQFPIPHAGIGRAQREHHSLILYANQLLRLSPFRHIQEEQRETFRARVGMHLQPVLGRSEIRFDALGFTCAHGFLECLFKFSADKLGKHLRNTLAEHFSTCLAKHLRAAFVDVHESEVVIEGNESF